MRTTRAIRRDQEAVSPVIATILMVAITVVLAAVLYVMVSGLVTGPGATPQAIGISIGSTTDGQNWKLSMTSVPSTLSSSNVNLVVLDASGTVVLASKALGDLTSSTDNATFVDLDADGTIEAGDYILLSKNTYPSGYEFQLLGTSGVLAQGKLQ